MAPKHAASWKDRLRSVGFGAGYFVAGLFFACLGAPLRAQEPTRSSLAGSEAASAQRQGLPTDYNVRVGQVYFKVTANLRTEFSDNVNLADQADPKARPEPDLILRPGIDLVATWPLTAYNSLQLKLGLSADRHLNQTQLDTNGFVIAPGSELNFSLFIGDARLDLYDSFNLEQDPIADPTLSNVGAYGRFSNTAGTRLTWDLNQVIAVFGYAHSNIVSTTPNFKYLDSSTDSVSASANFLYAPELQFGLSTQASRITYADRARAGLTTVQIGPTVNWTLTRYTHVQASGGAQLFYFRKGQQGLRDQTTFPGVAVATAPNASGKNQRLGAYGSVLIDNHLNNYFSQTLDFELSNSGGFAADLTTIASVNYTGSWRVNRFLTLNLGLGYENVKEEQGGSGEKLSRRLASLGFGYQLTPHLDLEVNYNFVRKDSDLLFRNYVQNALTLELRYDF